MFPLNLGNDGLADLGHEMTDESIAKATDFMCDAFKVPANDTQQPKLLEMA
ncbi:MAG: hypothetical protein ACAH83_20410 [Alphaproteobacteria bacterium]